MRLFIAINFQDEIKVKLIETQDLLKKYALRGNFTSPENLHLTLVFLGEVAGSRVREVENVMDEVNVKPFTINISGIGSFKRDKGDLLWAGIEKNKSLSQIHRQLSEGLDSAGFSVEKRAFSPHLTLARNVVLPEGADNLPLSCHEYSVYVKKISLMKSELCGPKPVYTGLYEKEL